MKKEPGVNGDWIPVSMEERVHNAAIPSLVALGTPMLVQMQYAFSDGWGDRGWLMPSVIWFYGLLFWVMSTARQLFSAKRWEWTPEALEEKYRYWTDARKASRRFWGHWWVRFPIGLLFLAYGVHAFESRDFSTQWVSLILMMSGFVTPFVFVAELALLPLMIIAMFAYLAVVVAIPISVILMMAVLALMATMMVAMARRDPRPPKPRGDAANDPKLAGPEAANAADANAPAATTEAPASPPAAVAEPVAQLPAPEPQVAEVPTATAVTPAPEAAK